MSEALYAQMKQTVIDGEVEDAERLAQEGLDAGLDPSEYPRQGFRQRHRGGRRPLRQGRVLPPRAGPGRRGHEGRRGRPAARHRRRRRGPHDPRRGRRRHRRRRHPRDRQDDRLLACSPPPASRSPTWAATCPSTTFVAKCQEDDADLLLLSALLTTTMPNQQKTIEALKAAGLRDKVKVMIGGAPTTRAWADEIGADGYAEDAIEAVATAKTHPRQGLRPAPPTARPRREQAAAGSAR